MQILKEEIRESLLCAAIDEFYQKGFEKASLRIIAKKAKMTVGNVYHYFKSKEMLFKEVVTPVKDEFIHFMQGHEESIVDIRPENFQDQLDHWVDLLSTMMIKHRKVFIILIDGSEGTKLSTVKNQLEQYAEEHVKDHLRDIYPDRKTYEPLAGALVRSYLEGYWHIIREYKDPKKIRDLITEYTKLIILGLINIPEFKPEKKEII